MRSYVFDKKEKGLFTLLKNCISNDVTRQSLCHAYYNGEGCIYATTGYRLVKISAKSLSEKLGDKPGYFDINGSVLLESDFSRDPIDYERVINLNEGERFILPKTTTVKGKYMDSLIYAAVCHYTGKVFDPELFQGVKEVDWIIISHTGNSMSVMLAGDYNAHYNVTFVAMAINASFMDKSEELKKTA